MYNGAEEGGSMHSHIHNSNDNENISTRQQETQHWAALWEAWQSLTVNESLS